METPDLQALAAEKARLRRVLHASWPGDAARAAESRAICAHLTAWEPFRQAAVVGGYVPMAREADITPLLRWVLEAGHQLALPRCGPAPEMRFHRVVDLSALTPGRWRVPEPPEDAPPISPEALALLLVPLEGVDASGHRLGKGGGYYDRSMGQSRALRVGIALSWQEVPSIPCAPWDQALDALADARGVRLFSRGSRIPPTDCV